MHLVVIGCFWSHYPFVRTLKWTSGAQMIQGWRIYCSILYIYTVQKYNCHEFILKKVFTPSFLSIKSNNVLLAGTKATVQMFTSPPVFFTLRWALTLLGDVVAPPHPAPCSHLYKLSWQLRSVPPGGPDEVWRPSAAGRSVRPGAAALRPESSLLRFLLRSKGQRGASRPRTRPCRHTRSPAWGCRRRSPPEWQHSHTRCSSLRLTAESDGKEKMSCISAQ